MIREMISIDDAIALMNEALQADSVCITGLCSMRMACNDGLANHPAIQVLDIPMKGTSKRRKDQAVLGFLGILNGLFGVDEKGYGSIAASFGKDGIINKFVRTPPNA